jgi:tripartite ATP-independent transporter DctM subunit
MLLIVISFFVLVVLGVPIAFVLGLTSLIYILVSGTISLNIVALRIYGGMDDFILLAIPFFILAGQLMSKSGITRDLVQFSNLLVGRMRGSLAQINIVTSTIFAGLTGAAASDAAAVGAILIPSMEKEGYTPEYAAAVTACASVIGPIIPPSIVMIVYASITGESVAALFAGGFVPGLAIALGLMIIVYIIAVKENHPYRKESIAFHEAMVTTARSLVALLVPLIILGGILGGFFTPTEASAVACTYALIIGILFFRSLDWPKIKDCLIETVKISAMVLLIIACARLFGLILTMEKIPELLANLFLGITKNPFMIILIMNFLLLIMGTLLEPGSNVIILAPILAPVAANVGIDPLHFALIMIINLNIGMVTPPVGISLFVVASIAKVPFEKVAMKSWPFIAVEIGVLLLLSYLPGVTLFLPRLLGLH